MHNGYVRQGWILLINPTGYIVPPARDGHTPLRPTPPRSRSNEDAPLRRAGAPLPRSSAFLDLLFSSVSTSGTRAVSFCRDELCRRVPAPLVCVVIISLSLCVLAPKAVPVRSTARRPSRPVSSVRKKAGRCRDVEARRNGTCRSGELP